MTALSWSRPSSRFKRAFGASLALLALAMASGVPTVHAWAHEVSEYDHHSDVALESSHHDEHPSALHADWLALRSVDLDVSPALSCESIEFVAAATMLRLPDAAADTRPLGSRPPAPNPARGPPIV